MRSLILKTAGIAVFMALGFLAVPSASAQTTYPPVPPPPASAQCQGLPAPTISFSNPPPAFTFTWPGGQPCVVTVTLILASTPTVIYSGALPANGQISGVLPAGITPGEHTLTINAKLADGGTYFARYGVSVPAAAAAGGASAPAAAAAVPAPTAADLAFTGGDIQLPIAIGASLVGLGGLALLAARKRNYKL